MLENLLFGSTKTDNTTEHETATCQGCAPDYQVQKGINAPDNPWLKQQIAVSTDPSTAAMWMVTVSHAAATASVLGLVLHVVIECKLGSWHRQYYPSSPHTLSCINVLLQAVPRVRLGV